MADLVLEYGGERGGTVVPDPIEIELGPDGLWVDVGEVHHH